MNIFYLDHDTEACAAMHVDKHCVKMILEYAQLLSTAHRVIDEESLDAERDGLLYKATHVNHPSAVWVRRSAQNYRWLFQLFCSLLNEYTHRYGKVHKSSALMPALEALPKGIDMQSSFSQPTPAMPEQYIVAGDAVLSYRQYYLGEKTRMFNWKNRPRPAWCE